MHNGYQHDLDRARSALHFLDPGGSREDWHRIGRAAIAAGLSVDDLDAWSASAPNYRGSRDVASAFRTIRPAGGTSAGTLFYLAQQAGWREGPSSARERPTKAPARPVEPPQAPKAGMGAAEVWNRCVPATALHPYIQLKAGKPDGLRVVPEGDPLRIAGLSMAGALVVPIRPVGGGEPVSLQFVAGGGQAVAWRDAGRPTKLNLKDIQDHEDVSLELEEIHAERRATKQLFWPFVALTFLLNLLVLSLLLTAAAWLLPELNLVVVAIVVCVAHASAVLLVTLHAVGARVGRMEFHALTIHNAVLSSCREKRDTT